VWTLEIEIKFYLLCACITPWLRRGDKRIFVLAPLIAAAIVLPLSGYYDAWISKHSSRFAMAWVASVDAQMMLYMLIGTVFHYLYRGWMRPARAAMLVSCLSVLFAYFAFKGYVRANAAAIAVSYTLALVVFTACYALRHRFQGGGVSGWLADISYPLYAVHGVAGYVLLNLLVRSGVPTDAALAVTVAAALLVAWTIHVAVEKPTHRLATKVARALSPKRPSTEQPVTQHSLAA
jgi:peptidoglycan/LPS O-acetylase OafA/YrhL